MTEAPTNEGRIGRYRLIKRLAVGGMADIYLAQQYGRRGYERTVVVKTIRSDLLDEEDLIAMLMEEARIASRLRHDNIVELYEVGEEGVTQFLAMEFVFGRDLGQIRDRCQEKGVRFPAEHVATVLADVLDALHYAHHQATTEDGKKLAVIHRDVSPQNIIVGFDGSVKLLDFGLAKAAAQISRTRAGVLKGKYAYMSPEQVNFRGVDQRADLFSVGVILWEMMTQQRLFYRVSDYETVKAVVRCSVPFPKTVQADLPWDLSWVAWRALREKSAVALQRRQQDAVVAGQRGHPPPSEGARPARGVDGLSVRGAARIARSRPAPGAQRSHTTSPDLGCWLRAVGGGHGPGSPSATGPPSAGAQPAAEHRCSGLAAAILGTWRWFLLVFAALVFLSIAAGVYIGSSYDERYGYLHVVSDSDHVAVVVGGKALGEAPVERIPVIPGRHRIVGRFGEKVKTVEVRVKPGESKVVRLRFNEKDKP